MEGLAPLTLFECPTLSIGIESVCYFPRNGPNPVGGAWQPPRCPNPKDRVKVDDHSGIGRIRPSYACVAIEPAHLRFI